MAALTPEQQARIVELYKNGETFRQASEQLPTAAELEHNRGFYDAIAVIGQLNNDQARSILRSACDPPGKAKCRWATRYIAEQLESETGVALTDTDVTEVLKNHFEVE
jgi:hypothetical protein